MMVIITIEDESWEVRWAEWRSDMWKVFFKGDYDDLWEREMDVRDALAAFDGELVLRSEMTDSDYMTENDEMTDSDYEASDVTGSDDEDI